MVSMSYCLMFLTCLISVVIVYVTRASMTSLSVMESTHALCVCVSVALFI